MQDSGNGSAHTKLTDPCSAHVLHMFTCKSDAMTTLHVVMVYKLVLYTCKSDAMTTLHVVMVYKCYIHMPI